MLRRKLFASMSLALSALTIIASTGTGFALAATSKTAAGGNALKISPVRSDVEIKPGASKVVDVYVQNLTSSAATLHGTVNDFSADKNETGQPNIILSETQSAPAHSLKQFASSIANFTLQPGEQKDVKVTITIPVKAAPGGYYGAIRFEPASTSTDKSVNLAASVASLVLVKVPGDVAEKMTIVSFDVRRKDSAQAIFTDNKSLTTVVRFQNTGNIQEEPFGKILLKKGSKVLATYEVNSIQPRGNVLPDSIRRFDIAIPKVGSLGKYTVEGNFGYGNSGQLLTATKTFYVIPVAVIVLAVAAILALIFAIFGLPRMIRSYNNRVIQKASKKTGKR